MQNESNHTAELLNGEVNQEQAELLKLLLKDANNEPVLDKYLSLNTINKKTRNALFHERLQLTTFENNFYLLTEKIYDKIDKKLKPLTYEELTQKLKEAESELNECRGAVVSLYTFTSNLIHNNESMVATGWDFTFKSKFDKDYFKFKTIRDNVF